MGCVRCGGHGEVFRAEMLFNQPFDDRFENAMVKPTIILTNWDVLENNLVNIENLFRQVEICVNRISHRLGLTTILDKDGKDRSIPF
jgi:hypothetical protein